MKETLKLCALDEVLSCTVIIDNPFFKVIVSLVYPNNIQFRKANASESEALLLDLQISISDSRLPFYFSLIQQIRNAQTGFKRIKQLLRKIL